MDMDQKVHPDLQAAFAQIPVIDFTDLETIRNLELMPPAERLTTVTISDRQIPGPPDAPEVRVRIYEPADKADALPAVLWIHGGGYILGTPDQDDGLCQRIVTEGNCVVVAVDYRLAPEHPFPAPIEDCYAVLAWMADAASELGIDHARIAVAGASAGGGLTAALALLARDRGGPALCFQMPLYPMLDDRNVTPSSHEVTDGRVWNRDTNIAAWQMYLGSDTQAGVSPYAAPTRATDLSGLPPTYTCVGGADVFRDETTDYVARLQQAGVPVEFHIYPGCFHGFELFIPDADVSKRTVAQYVAALTKALHPVRPAPGV